MITSDEGLEQARQQLKNMEDVIAELLREAARMHPSQLALQLEGPMAMIRQLRSEIDEYVGIERAKRILADRSPEMVGTPEQSQ